MFEYLLIVLLSERYELLNIYRLSWAQFLLHRSWDRRMNAWYIARSKRVLSVAEDLTVKLTRSESLTESSGDGAI